MVTGKQLLLVEPSAVERFILSVWLENEGFQVTTANDAGEALPLAVSFPFEVVVVETRLPDSEGLEFIDKLRRFNPALPILAIYSGLSNLENEQGIFSRLEKLGVQAALKKPFEREAFLGKLNRTMERCLKLI